MKRFKEFTSYIRFHEMLNENYSTLDLKWFAASISNNYLELRKIINQGIDINLKRSDGTTALHSSSNRGFIYNIKELLKQPTIDVNIQDIGGNTPIMNAANNKRNSVIFLLLRHPKIDILIKNKDGRDFIDIYNDNFNIMYLMDYSLQTDILENGREDILLLFEKYKLVHPDIKKEHPELFKAADWGLI